MWIDKYPKIIDAFWMSANIKKDYEVLNQFVATETSLTGNMDI